MPSYVQYCLVLDIAYLAVTSVFAANILSLAALFHRIWQMRKIIDANTACANQRGVN